VFTARAARAWKDSRYPYPQEMTDRLTALAQAATDLHSNSGRMPRLAQWFYDNHGLKFAPSDEKLSGTPSCPMRSDASTSPSTPRRSGSS
jgi:hypothetical protein